MDATVIPNEMPKWKSLTYRVVYRLIKAVAMSLTIGFIAGWEIALYQFVLIYWVDSIEDFFSKSYKRCGFRFSLISLLCILVFSSLVFVLYSMFFHTGKEIALMMAWLGLWAGGKCMDIVASFKTPKDAL